jgi:hypothetical protein
LRLKTHPWQEHLPGSSVPQLKKTIKENSMKRILSILVLAALATLAVLAPVSGHLVPGVQASSGCTVANLNGTYAFSFNGFANVGKSGHVKTVPTDDVGVVTFDGAGNVSASYTDSTNGHISRGNHDVGTYTVNSDCTGSIIDTTSGGTWDTAILANGIELYLIGTNKGITQTGLAKRL